MTARSLICCALLYATLCAATFAQSPTAPPLQDLAGKPVSLNSYRGRAVLLNFWATWCAPCRQEMPELAKAARQLDPRRAVIIGIAADDRDAVNLFLKKLSVPYPVVIGDPDQMFAWSARLGNLTEGLPFSALQDEHGKVVWMKSGGSLTAAEVLGCFENSARCRQNAAAKRTSGPRSPAR